MALTQPQDPSKKRVGPFAAAPDPLNAPNMLPTQVVHMPDQLPTQTVRPTFMDKLAAGPRAFG